MEGASNLPFAFEPHRQGRAHLPPVEPIAVNHPAGRRVAGGLASALAAALLVTAAWSSPSPPAAATPSRADVATQFMGAGPMQLGLTQPVAVRVNESNTR